MEWVTEQGEPINEGDTVTSFRGETGTFNYTGRLSNNPLFPPKVIVDGYEYNANVWGMYPKESE